MPVDPFGYGVEPEYYDPVAYYPDNSYRPYWYDLGVEAIRRGAETAQVIGSGWPSHPSPSPSPSPESATRPQGRPTGIGLVSDVWSELGYAKDLANSGEPYAFATSQLAAGVPVQHLVAALRASKWFVDEGFAKSLNFCWRQLVDETALGGKFRWSGTEWPGETGEPAPPSGRYLLPEGSAYTIAKPKRRIGGIS